MNKKINTLFALLISISCEDIGVENDDKIINKSFINSFGSNWYDYGWGLTQLHDGGFIITGGKQFKSNNSKDLITIRTDKNGFGMWQKNFGGTENEEGYSVVQTPDGNILTVGYSWSYGNEQDIFVVKTDLSGRKMWQKTYGGSNREIGHKSIITSDGDVMIVGQTNSPGISRGNDDVWLSKIDQDGNEKWYKAYGESNHEVGYDIVELDSGEFMIVGYRDFYTNGAKDILLIKVDNSGNKIWEKTFGIKGQFDEVGYSISKSKDYGYLICSSTKSIQNDWYDPKVINVDFDGNVIWNKTYNGSGLKHTRWVATSLKDGGAAIVGTTNYYREIGSNEDAYVINIDKDGEKIWDISTQGGENDWGWDIIETFSGEIVIVGSTKSYGAGLFDIFLSRINIPTN